MIILGFHDYVISSPFHAMIILPYSWISVFLWLIELKYALGHLVLRILSKNTIFTCSWTVTTRQAS